VTLSCVVWTLYGAHGAITVASEDPRVSKQGTAGKRKDIKLMILRNLK